MWLAPGNRSAEELGTRRGAFGHDGRLGRVHVQVTRARMMDVFRQNPFEHAMQPLHALALDVARAAPGLQ